MKLKSHSGAKKRVKRTGSGKLVLHRGHRNHLLQQKSKRQKRLSRTLLADSSAIKQLRHLAPYL
jgi:large subunit ribosomal protein L35